MHGIKIYKDYLKSQMQITTTRWCLIWYHPYVCHYSCDCNILKNLMFKKTKIFFFFCKNKQTKKTKQLHKHVTQRKLLLSLASRFPALNLHQLHKNNYLPSDWPAHQGKTHLSQGSSISLIFIRLNVISVSFHFLALSSQAGDPTHSPLMDQSHAQQAGE